VSGDGNLLDVRKTAERLDVSEKFVRRHAMELGAVRVGRLLRFRPSEVERYIRGQRLGPK
jgi:excisionase family DNA binding protein